MVNKMAKLEVSDAWKELYRTKNWVDLLRKTTEKYPDNEAIAIGNERITYKEYWDKVSEYAKALYAIGVKEGTHVAIWMTNRPEWCFARFAIYKLELSLSFKLFWNKERKFPPHPLQRKKR